MPFPAGLVFFRTAMVVERKEDRVALFRCRAEVNRRLTAIASNLQHGSGAIGNK
ncbi:unannotated protein [freshwater metagenome]|uniref:Unannotated protein n=1 Tax=freshwater metagenome TaxID=449393 RepID=A0A6J6L6X8_9ZZZZ